MSNQALIRKPSEGIEEISLDEAIRIGDFIAKSKMFPEITDQARAVVAILAGRELGIPPLASVRGIHVIKGKVEIGAGLLAALIRKSGKYDYKILQSTHQLCDLAWFENGQEVGRSNFTIDKAKRAKLIKPDSNWEKFPEAMLFARALTAGQKLYAPDIGIGGVYAEGEISEIEQVIDIEPARHISPDQMPTAKEVFDAPRPVPTEPALPAAWQGDSIGVQVADQQISNKIREGLNTIVGEIAADAANVVSELNTPLPERIAKEMQAPASQPTATRPPMQPFPSAPAVAEVKKGDPVPLKVTLSPAQQRVLDTMRSATSEHRKDLAEVWEMVYAMLGRKIRRAAELTEEEAEKVFAYLQTLCSKWSAETKPEPEPAPVKYDRKAPRHNAELAKAIEEAIKKLTILGVPFGGISDSIAELIEREFGRKIPNRYDLTDEEAQSALEYLQTRILEKECETAVAADDV